jgi:hypothetical protein
MTLLDYHALASSQYQDAALQDIVKNGSALRLERVHIPGTGVNLNCDTSTLQPRPFITTPSRRQVFDSLHGLSHTLANVTVKWVSRFLWPGVGKDCRACTRVFTPCQRPKVTRHVKARSGVLSSHRHVSFMCISTCSGLSSGFGYCLTAIDRYACWPEALLFSDITAESFAKAFVSVWVVRLVIPR